MSRSPQPHLSSSQAVNNTKRTTRCSRHSHTRHIWIIFVRRHLIQPASSFDVRLERTKGRITRAFTNTNHEAQASFSPQLCHAATRQFISPLPVPYPSLRISPATQVIPYSFLQTHLDIPTIRLLEDLIIDAIYLDIIRGKLDQNEQQFEVEYTIGRDVPPESVTEILSSLENWYVILSP